MSVERFRLRGVVSGGLVASIVFLLFAVLSGPSELLGALAAGVLAVALAWIALREPYEIELDGDCVRLRAVLRTTVIPFGELRFVGLRPADETSTGVGVIETTTRTILVNATGQGWVEFTTAVRARCPELEVV